MVTGQELKLHRPQDQLAGCCWLPRFADKIRAAHRKQLPLFYRLALGSSLGVDGYFLRNFGLTFPSFRQAVLTAAGNEELALWFNQQPQCTPDTIQAWNSLAPQLGKPGNPGYLTRHLLKLVLYPKSILQPVTSLFEAIDQDEQT
jgi:hypothetical protein